ncbi:hypothetical protein CEXT_813241 [Caerostris extrusa]|uniref:Uncharacterized protein n=1 Tax=Caerostris extrusa TaxID=172846 RepID=A0AAV4TKD0_CAEEX|nr:hypothetical protein CEXT_813241 [Caerostris extrusa]
MPQDVERLAVTLYLPFAYHVTGHHSLWRMLLFQFLFSFAPFAWLLRLFRFGFEKKKSLGSSDLIPLPSWFRFLSVDRRKKSRHHLLVMDFKTR